MSIERIIKINKEEEAEGDTDEKDKESIERNKNACSFVDRNKDLFSFRAGKYGVNIKPAPEGLNTFAYNLENSEIYVNDMFYKKGMSEKEKLVANEKSTFAVEHEIEHMLEHKSILKESENDNPWKIKGKEVWENYMDSLSDKAFATLDNCVSDIRQNKSVIEKSNKHKKEIENEMYKELFPTEDLRGQRDQYGVFYRTPKHIQFSEALLVEARSRECIVDDDVRGVINKLKEIKNEKTGKNILDTITNPNVPMSTRLFWQYQVIKPLMEELKEKDFENKNNQNQNENQNKQQNKGQGNEKRESQNDKSEKDDDGKDKQKSENGNNEDAESDDSDEGTDAGNKSLKPKRKITEEEYNKAFEDDYKRAEKRMLPKASKEEIKKSVEKFLENHPELGESEQEKIERQKRESEEKRAKDLGVSINDLRNYNNLSKELRETKNFEKINDLIKRIVSERKKEKFVPKYPLEEGEELIDPAGLVTSVKGGNMRPKVWQDTETKEWKGELFSEIEMSLVFDRSESMKGEKIKEVQKAAVLFMNSQKDLQDEIFEGENEDEGLIKGLKVSFEVYSFQNTEQDFIPVKSMSDKFEEGDRIKVCAHFNNAPGDRTTDANCLSAIYENLNKDEEKKEKLKENELKKVVIVLTDGDSHQSSKVAEYLKKLRDLKVSVLGIGITNEGKSVLTTYAKGSKVAEKAEDISKILEEIIEKEFSDLLPLKN